jgi:hydroxymethylcytosylglucuronate/cytosylglucuronate synthase
MTWQGSRHPHGMNSPNAPRFQAYCDLVIAPAIRAVAAAGFEAVYLTGGITRFPPKSHVSSSGCFLAHFGPTTHHEFVTLLANADILLTSPGLTTLLESATARVPTICLPSQNVSQLFNAAHYARRLGEELVTQWPLQNLAGVLRVHARNGEVAALDVLRTLIEQLPVKPTRLSLGRQLARALQVIPSLKGWNTLVKGTTFGTRETAQIVVANLWPSPKSSNP